MKSRAAAAALLVYFAGIVAGVATILLSIAAQDRPGVAARPVVEAVADPIFGVLFGGIGTLIAVRRPGNRVGWSLLVAGIAFCSGAAAHAYGEFEFARHPGAEPLAGSLALAFWGSHWTVLLTSLVFLLVLFPSGQFPSRAWRWASIATAAGFASVALTLPLVTEYGDEPYEAVKNPLYVSALDGIMPVLGVWIGILHMVVLAAGVSLVLRFRQSRGVERAQFKWLALAVAFMVVGLVFQSFSWDSAPLLINIVFGAGLVGVPVTVAVAVLRYRLYDIDILINRTLVYGSLTGATVGVYLALVVTLGWVARAVTGQEGNEVAVAATTLIVAALVQPARGRIQALVDRRFYRSRYDAARTIEAFQTRLRDELELGTLRNELAATARAALQPVSISVWVRESRGIGVRR